MTNSLSYMTRPKNDELFREGWIEAWDSGWRMAWRVAAVTLLKHKFDPLNEAKRKRLWAWPETRLDELIVAISDAPSLEALGLMDEEKPPRNRRTRKPKR